LLLSVAAATNAAGKAFLATNKKAEGVVTLKSGLQYKVMNDGTGTKSPLVSTPCECHYAGSLIDGTEFDSSIKRGRPSTFAPNQVIKGWTEAMQLMKEGDKWELYIPSELGYGDRDRGQFIKGGDVLIFTLELIKVKGAHKEL
jgi:FKBP-type peptidyl-prolyl cis-trans isomerase FklB|tara:strand:+ start:128 stop:556 length:429 start_codon:yes stop_codon:yes gene_type:complete